jgi:hypothetical protein
MAAPALANFDSDNSLEIIAVTNVGQIYVWETQAPFNPNRLPWPMGRLNPQRTASKPTVAGTGAAMLSSSSSITLERKIYIPFVGSNGK